MKTFNKSILLGFISLFVLSSGCAANKVNHQRGWLGGDYLEVNECFFKKHGDNYFANKTGVIPALPDEVKTGQSSTILVSRIHLNTPLAKADILQGDLIIKANNNVFNNVKSFRKIVDNMNPGDNLPLTIYRNGKLFEIQVTVGREIFQEWKTLSLGFKLGPELDPLPNPNFSILSVVSFKKNNNRLELNSPEFVYFKQAEDSDKVSQAGFEGWNMWLGFFGFGGTKKIISQEIVAEK